MRRAPGIALATTSAPITKALIGINVVIYLIGASQGGGLSDPGSSIYRSGSLYRHMCSSGRGCRNGGWFRLVTAMFLHENLLHIGFNMLALYLIGTPVEQYLGRARYVGLYFVVGARRLRWCTASDPARHRLGASGAIFGILGAMLILEWQITGRLAGNAMTWIVINLVISFSIPNISWGGHVGGLVGGILVTLAYAHWRGGRAQYGKLGVGGILGLVVVAAGSVVLAYWKVRGYA